jgi:hypothetical protein
VSLDPGLTIGICVLESGIYHQSQLAPTDYPHPHETLFDVLSELNPKVILYERFDFRAAKNGAVLIGVEYIGVIELYAQTKCIEVIKISPGLDFAFWNDKKLKIMDMYIPGKIHAMDATRIMNAHRMKTDEAFKKRVLDTLKDGL